MVQSKFLTENGYIAKNSPEAKKADFFLDTEQKIILSNGKELSRAGEVFKEFIVSFCENGKAVITRHFTHLGVEIMKSFGKNVSLSEPLVERGTYTINATDDKADISFVCNGKTSKPFYIDLTTGEVYYNEICQPLKMVAFTVADILKFSGVGKQPVQWTDGVDGKCLKDIKYGDRERNLMDIYIPAVYDVERENGVILFIHGGSWTMGNKDELGNLAKKYAKKGYFTATMNHTYAMTEFADGTKCTFHTIVDEVHQVFEKIKELSVKNGWGITKSALYGYSSGCHIAFLYAYGRGLRKDAPLPVVLVTGMVGCLDFRQEYWEHVQSDGPQVAALGLNDMRLAVKDLCPQEEWNRLIDSISPLAFARMGQAVPSVIAYADLDESLIDYVFAEALEEQLSKFGIENYCVSLPNSGHFTGNNPQYTKTFKAKADEYLKKYFGY